VKWWWAACYPRCTVLFFIFAPFPSNTDFILSPGSACNSCVETFLCTCCSLTGQAWLAIFFLFWGGGEVMLFCTSPACKQDEIASPLRIPSLRLTEPEQSKISSPSLGPKQESNPPYQHQVSAVGSWFLVHWHCPEIYCLDYKAQQCQQLPNF
jgi:hypothetical protein